MAVNQVVDCGPIGPLPVIPYGLKGQFMHGFTFWALAVVAAFCVGLSKGGAPAFGSLAVPILSLHISPIAGAGLLLLVSIKLIWDGLVA